MKVFVACVLAAAVAVALAQSTCSNNLVYNGGFESPRATANDCPSIENAEFLEPCCSVNAPAVLQEQGCLTTDFEGNQVLELAPVFGDLDLRQVVQNVEPGSQCVLIFDYFSRTAGTNSDMELTVSDGSFAYARTFTEADNSGRDNNPA